MLAYIAFAINSLQKRGVWIICTRFYTILLCIFSKPTMIKLAIFFFLLPTICHGLECVFHTDPIHPVNPRFQERNVTGVKKYECSAQDKYCVYFEGNLEATGRNQAFSVRACESDLMHYVDPIGDTIGHKLSVKCVVSFIVKVNRALNWVCTKRKSRSS